MIDQHLLDILVCPESRQPLRLADGPLLERLNEAIAAGTVANRGGQPVRQPLVAALVRDDGGLIYPIVEEIPVLLVDEAIPWEQVSQAAAASPARLPGANRMAEKSIFQRIIDREIPADVVYEDDLCIALRDIHPQAPTHLVVIPKKAIRSIDEMADEDAAIVGRVVLAMQKIAAQLGLTSGYRVVANNGRDAGQEVMHLHFHMMAGRRFGWPPG